MRPRIKLRALTSTDQLNLLAVISTVRSTKQMGQVTVLLQRYGVAKLSALLPKQVAPFTTELKAVLADKASDPSDSLLNPTIMEMPK